MLNVIIVGGGMAGATLALALAQLSGGRLAVALVEAGDLQADHHPGFDARAIALAQGSCQLLERIGVWQAIADVACPIRRVLVNEQGHAGETRLDATDYQLAALGQVVELHEVGKRLFRLLGQAAGVSVHCPARVSSVKREQARVVVGLDDGTTLQGQLLVAADGTHSPVARQCGVQWQQTTYSQLAVIANVMTALPHEQRAFERFTRHGPLALLPLSANRCSLVWCHDLAAKEQVMSWSDAQFGEQLQQAFGWRLGRIDQVGRRDAYPLMLSQATRVTGHRLALVGNAAQTLHPVAGQGFNLGIRDVLSLAETLTEEGAKQDVGRYSLLARYQQRRQRDSNSTIALTDGLVRLFANNWWPLVIPRHLALMATGWCSLSGDKLAQRALGWVAR